MDQLTAQGYDAQFGVHVVGHFYLTKLLLPALIAGAKSSPDSKSRVVNTSSSASLGVTGINFNTLKESPLRKEKGGQFLYGQSKLVCGAFHGNSLFSKSDWDVGEHFIFKRTCASVWRSGNSFDRSQSRKYKIRYSTQSAQLGPKAFRMPCLFCK